MQILIIQTGEREPLLLTTPLIRACAVEKGAIVTIVVAETTRNLLNGNPHVNAIYTIAEFRNHALLRLRYDAIFDLSNSIATKILRLGLMGPKLIYHSTKSLSEWMYVRFKLGALNQRNISQQYLDLASTLSIKGDDSGVDFFIPEADKVENDWLPETHRDGYAVVAVAAEKNTQKLPVNRIIELCDRINKPIVLIGEQEDKSTCAEVEAFFQRGTEAEELEIENLNKKAVIFNACAKFNFNQRASLIKESTWVFTFDSIYMHLAAAFRKPLFITWGSSSPLFGAYPYQARFTIFENNKISCRPCSRSGYNHCPKGHFKCMQDVTFDFYLPD